MAIKTISYKVDLSGISPATEQFGGTQGDHKVTAVRFVLSDELFELVSNTDINNKLFYRFDVYNGENSIWQSESMQLTNNEITIELEEKHTRFGGKVKIYLVITAVSGEGETELELYSFPVVIKLNTRFDGTYQEGENYESVTSLAETTKQNALQAEMFAAKAKKAYTDTDKLALNIEEKLQNGDFDGLGVQNTEIIDGNLIITYTDGTVKNLGNIKGEKGDPLNPNDYYNKTDIDNIAAVKHVVLNDKLLTLTDLLNSEICIGDEIVLSAPHGVNLDQARITNLAEPSAESDAVTKGYVDNALNNKIEKISLKDISLAEDYEVGVYGSKYNTEGEYYNGKHSLIKVTNGAQSNTIPKRDASGAISVSINIKDKNGNNYVGGAAPHTWVNDKFNELNERIYDFKNSANASMSSEIEQRTSADSQLQQQLSGLKTSVTNLGLLQNIVADKKITKYTIDAGGSLTLKKNAIYLFLRDGESNTVSIYNDGVVEHKGTDNELTFETGLVIVPDNTMGSSEQYPPSYYGLALKVTSASFLGTPNLDSAKFSVLKKIMENGGLIAKENSKNSTFSVWEVAL